jgi:hypothetical protein
MIRSVFGHMRFSLPEGIAFWALILCDFSQRPQGRRPGWASSLFVFLTGRAACLAAVFLGKRAFGSMG